MNCTNCGHPLKPGSHFCAQCGAPVAQSTESAPNRSGAAGGAQPVETAAFEPAPQPVQNDRDLFSSSPGENDLFHNMPQDAGRTDAYPGSYDRNGAYDPNMSSRPTGDTYRQPDETYRPSDRNSQGGEIGQDYPQDAKPPKKGKGKVIIIILVIVAVMFFLILACTVFAAFNLHWFGLDFDELMRKAKGEETPETTTSAVDDLWDYMDDDTWVATQPAAETTTQAQRSGTQENPIRVSGEKRGVSGHIYSSSEACCFAFTPSRTGYYYIEVPDEQKRLQFKVYDGTELMGTSEYQNSGKQMLFYNMFFAGKTYQVQVTSSQAQDISANFVDHTGDKNRRIKEGEAKELNPPYTYLRKFTPTSSGEYTAVFIAKGSLGKVALYDKNWNPIEFQMYVDDTSFEDDYYFFTVNLQSGTDYNFVVTPGSKIAFSVSK